MYASNSDQKEINGFIVLSLTCLDTADLTGGS